MSKMEKRKLRIGELADYLQVEKFVIRFWEKEFHIKAHRSEGGQRFYYEKDLKKFETIKELLYNQGFTIAGAKKYLKNPTPLTKEPAQPQSPIIASKVTTLDELTPVKEMSEQAPVITIESKPDIAQQIIDLQRKLLKLRELL